MWAGEERWRRRRIKEREGETGSKEWEWSTEEGLLHWFWGIDSPEGHRFMKGLIALSAI